MSATPSPGLTRRQFVANTTAAALLAGSGLRAQGLVPSPWHRRSLRWGQVNLAEVDPERFDLAFWRAHWRETRLQGVVVNAGGIVAFYPTTIPLHRRASHLGSRDLFGEIRTAARAEGISVLARMDSSRADEAFFRAHPDWFARDAAGQPYLVTGLYMACVNGPYYSRYIPDVLREIAGRYRPEGFADNNWNGPMRDQPCYCENCERAFRARSGHPVPRLVDWRSPVYRDWIRWNYERRLEIWDLFSAAAKEAGGPECAWIGMMAGAQSWQSRVFRDDREAYRRAPLIMLDDQRRFEPEGFQHNGEIGKRIHSVGGWDKLIPESMAMYQLEEHNFRLSAKPEPEARMWVLEGFAGGVQPWWHQIGARTEDRRMLATAPPLWQWHARNEQYLVNRMPLAKVGLVWSQRNMDFFGRDDAAAQVEDPWNGFTQALVRARLPYVPVHVDDIARVSAEIGLSAIILPNVVALSAEQAAGIRRFVEAGGGLLATGLSSLCDESGDTRPDFALGALFGAHTPPGHAFGDEDRRLAWAKGWEQTYLRLPAGPAARAEPVKGFSGTDILAYGGMLEALRIDPGAQVALTFIPPVPAAPAESAWMHVERTDTAALVLNERPGWGRVAYLPADIDRRFARDYLPDHGELLAALTRWVAHGTVPVQVEGPGFIDVQPYRQDGRVVLHVVNLTSEGTWRAPVYALTPVGPFSVSVALPPGVTGASVVSLVSGGSLAGRVANGWVHFETGPITDHEVVVIR